MNKSMIYKEEFKRAFLNRGMYLAILIGTIIIFIYSFIFLKIHMMRFTDIDGYIPFSNCTVTTYWVIKYGNPYFYYIYYLLAMVAVIPFGLSFLIENKTGLIKNILIRCDRTKYVSTKFIVTFISGGVAAVFMPLLSLLVNLAFIHIQKTTPIGAAEVGIHSSNMCKLYYTNTILYVLIFLFLYFIVGGLLASISLTVSTFSSNILTVFLTPFFIMLIMLFIRNRAQGTNYSIFFSIICPYDFLNGTSTKGYTIWVVIGMLIITGANYWLFRKRILTSEVF